MKKSIIQENKECYVCGRTDLLHLHHIFFGSANRKLSDQDGCICWLCMPHHLGKNGVHFNPDLDARLKKECQIAWMRTNEKSVEEFRFRYGKNYL